MFDKLQGKVLTVGISLAAGCGFTLFGYGQGVFGGLLTNPDFKATFNDPSSTVQSQTVSTYYLGAVVGALGSNYSGDLLGRRRSIMFGCCWLAVGGALQAAAVSLPMMLAGRVVAGVGTGLNTTAIPMWQVETSQRHHRGLLVALELVLVNFAQVFAAFVNFGFSYMPSCRPVSWRFPLAMQCFFALLTFVAVLPMPESPRWLLMKGRREEAARIVGRLRALPSTDAVVEREMKELDENLRHEREAQKVSVAEIFSNGPTQTRRRILMGCGTAVFQQASGINVVVNYLPDVLVDVAGLGQKLSLLIAAVNSINQLIFGILAMYLIDRVGRRTLMLVCSAAQALNYALVTVGVRFSATLWVLAVLFIFVYGCFYANGFLAIPWLYPAEINSQRFRNRGASISTMTNWLCVYIVTLVTPVGMDNLGWRFFLIFMFLNALIFPVVWFFYFETAKMSLQQIDLLFEIKYEKERGISLTEARRLALERMPPPPINETTAAVVDDDNINGGKAQVEHVSDLYQRDIGN